jgi:multidrug efflux pump subunit AcrA (membrane-fusion protein)
MKKFLRAIAYALALNFLVVAGGAAYLWRSGHLDKARALAIKDLLFPPAAAAAASTTQPSTQPSSSLDDFLRQASGRSVQEQIELIQHSVDARATQLDLQQRALEDQKAQIELATAQLARERTAFEARQKALDSAAQQAAQQASDQGFQDSLQIYSSMVPKQVKDIFMTLSDETMRQYLEAMPAGKSAKIIKEFKTPDETSRIQKVLERMRQPPSATQPAAAADTTPAIP